MGKIKALHLDKWIGYGLLGLYLIAAVVLVILCININIFPFTYIAILSIILAIIAVGFAIMHLRTIPSFIASGLSIIFIVGLIFGTIFVSKTSSTLTELSTVKGSSNTVSVYVLDEDPAQKVEDIAGYTVGILKTTGRENTNKAISEVESSIGSSLSIKEYDNMSMLNDLKKKEIGAVIVNDAFIGMASDAERYEWVSGGLRILATYSFEVENAPEVVAPDDLPETFVLYLSGIDTFGDITARSRSDVNILAVVNTRTKNMLLLSTPRDSYVSYSVTGGAKDKLTHAGIYGVDASIDALEKLYDINIDYYLRVNFTGFVEIIDALGGVEVYSDYDFTVQNIRDYHVGYNQVTGIEALAFARERYSFAAGDFQRAKNQMEVIRAVISKATSASMLANYTTVMDAIGKNFNTNMPEDQLTSLIRMQLQDMAPWNITSYTTNGTSRSAETYSMPGQQLYVIDLDQNAINQAKDLIRQVIDN